MEIYAQALQVLLGVFVLVAAITGVWFFARGKLNQAAQERLKSRLEDARETIADLRSDKADLATDLARAEGERDRFKAERDRYESELELVMRLNSQQANTGRMLEKLDRHNEITIAGFRSLEKVIAAAIKEASND
jgi:predicted nuclease with TOPRIM domain